MDRVVILFSAVLVLFVCCSSGSNVASSIVDPENDVRELSKPGKYKCALYFMGPLTKPEGAAYLRTVPLDLDAECSNGRVASESLRQKYARKCRDLVNTGLKGEYALNKPSPAKDVNGTIGDYWCQKVIGRNGCGFQYAVFLSTCGGPMEDTGLRGPEPICCKYDRGTEENKQVPCTRWTPISRHGRVPKFCEEFVYPGGRGRGKEEEDSSTESEGSRPKRRPTEPEHPTQKPRRRKTSTTTEQPPSSTQRPRRRRTTSAIAASAETTETPNRRRRRRTTTTESPPTITEATNPKRRKRRRTTQASPADPVKVARTTVLPTLPDF